MWYQPPFLALAAIFAGVGISRLHARSVPLGVGTSLVMCVAMAAHLPWSIPLDRMTQIEVEDAVRQPAGEYLAEVVAPDEAVTAEAAGYLGWFGRVELWDYPGLTSPRALDAVRSLPRDRRQLTDAIALLRPDWLVLRPLELDVLRATHADVADCYTERRRFGVVGPAVIDYGGLTRWNQDRALIVFQRAPEC
jgi:hypothetical protein